MKTVNNFVNSERKLFDSSIRPFLSPYVIVPFFQSKDSVCDCIVKENMPVSEGQTIAVSSDSKLNLTSDIHSPVPGIVDSIVKSPLPNGKVGKAVKIKFNGAFSYLGKTQSEIDWQSFTNTYLLDLFNNKGVNNTFSRSISLSKQIKEMKSEKKILVVRLFDEDPSRLTDLFIATKYTQEVIDGAFIVSKALQTKKIFFMGAKNISYNLDFSKYKDIDCEFIEVDTNVYPCGYKQNLIEKIKECNSFEDTINLNKSALFIDPQCAYDAYYAVFYGLPVIEHFVHVTGNCLRSAAMFKVRIGTPIQDLIEQCGGFKIKLGKLIINGMINGVSVCDCSIPITKYVKSINFVPAKELYNQKISPCVRCGKCREICPESLYPDLIYQYVVDGFNISDELKSTVDLCSECNLCNSVCPSRLSLSQSIIYLRNDKNEQ